MPLAKWKLAELATVFVERVIAHDATDISVEHDVMLPDMRLGDLRQVDVVVRYKVGGHSFLRTVEVQDRRAKVGSAFIDQVIAKADRLGAHQTTIVSIAGFTGPALRRIAEMGHRLDAVRLKPLRDEDLPTIFRTTSGLTISDDTRGVPLRVAQPEFWQYKGVSNGAAWYIELYDASVPGTPAAAAVITDGLVGDDDVAHIFLAGLAKPGSPRRLNRLGVRMTYAGGRQMVLQAMARAPVSARPTAAQAP